MHSGSPMQSTSHQTPDSVPSNTIFLILVAPSIGRGIPSRVKINLSLQQVLLDDPMQKARVTSSVSTYELGHEGNHEIEEGNGLNESETQNGIREQLTTQGRVAGNTVDESSEHNTDTDTGTSQTDGRRSHTNVLGDLNHGLGNLGRVRTALGLEGIAVGSLNQVGGLLALQGLERVGRTLIESLAIGDFRIELTGSSRQ